MIRFILFVAIYILIGFAMRKLIERSRLPKDTEDKQTILEIVTFSLCCSFSYLLHYR